MAGGPVCWGLLVVQEVQTRVAIALDITPRCCAYTTVVVLRAVVGDRRTLHPRATLEPLLYV